MLQLYAAQKTVRTARASITNYADDTVIRFLPMDPQNAIHTLDRIRSPLPLPTIHQTNNTRSGIAQGCGISPFLYNNRGPPRYTVSGTNHDTYNPTEDAPFSVAANKVFTAPPRHARIRLPDICMVCYAVPAPYVCPCKTRRYCSKNCQKRDWKRGKHKHTCPASATEDKM